MWLSSAVPLPSGQMNSHGSAETSLSSLERDIWLGWRNPPSQGTSLDPTGQADWLKRGKIVEYGNMHLSIWIHHSATDGKSKSNGLKPKRQLLTHGLKSPKGGRLQMSLDLVTEITATMSQFVSVSPLYLPGCFMLHPEVPSQWLGEATGSHLMAASWQLTLQTWHLHTISQGRREGSFIRALPKPRKIPAYLPHLVASERMTRPFLDQSHGWRWASQSPLLERKGVSPPTRPHALGCTKGRFAKGNSGCSQMKLEIPSGSGRSCWTEIINVFSRLLRNPSPPLPGDHMVRNAENTVSLLFS